MNFTVQTKSALGAASGYCARAEHAGHRPSRFVANHPPSQTTCLRLGPPAIVITFPRAPPYPTRMKHRSSHCKAGWNMPPGSKVQLLRVTPHVVLTTDPRATCFCESESPSSTHTHRPPPLPCRPWLLVDSASELECHYINMLAGDKFGRRRRRRRVLTAPLLTVHGHAQSSMGRWCREFPALPAPPPTHRDQTPTRLRAPWRTACGW
jgi:hypothetical protein